MLPLMFGTIVVRNRKRTCAVGAGLHLNFSVSVSYDNLYGDLGNQKGDQGVGSKGSRQLVSGRVSQLKQCHGGAHSLCSEAHGQKKKHIEG
jgi:hypothetical protein